MATFTYPSRDSRTSLLPSSYSDDQRPGLYRILHTPRRTRKGVFAIILFAFVGVLYLVFNVTWRFPEREEKFETVVSPTSMARVDVAKAYGAIALLWQTFNRLKPRIALSMPTHPDQNAAIWNFASNICSYVMLLNLERLRELRLMDSSAYRNYPIGPSALSPPTFMAITDIFEHLGYDYEVSSCLLDMYNTGLGHDDVTDMNESSSQIHTWATTPHQHQVILPKLLHFNCLDGTSRYYEWEGWSDPTNSLTKRWHAAVVYHVGAKWIWLNKGDRERCDATIRDGDHIRCDICGREICRR